MGKIQSLAVPSIYRSYHNRTERPRTAKASDQIGPGSDAAADRLGRPQKIRSPFGTINLTGIAYTRRKLCNTGHNMCTAHRITIYVEITRAATQRWTGNHLRPGQHAARNQTRVAFFLALSV